MTGVRQVTHRPTVVFAAENLETGDEALILTTPVTVREHLAVARLAERWDDEHATRRGSEAMRRTR